MASNGSGKGLHCLGGKEAGAELQAELRSWHLLPERARREYWELLIPNLAPEVDERLTMHVQKLMKEHELSPAQLAPSIKACRLMMRQAARLNVSPEQFAEDAAQVAGHGDALAQGLDSWYRQALPLLRKEIIMATLGEHGRMATAIDWRIDMITRSKRGQGINTAIGVLTFRYREGDTDKSITLQLLPELLDELRTICGEILS